MSLESLDIEKVNPMQLNQLYNWNNSCNYHTKPRKNQTNDSNKLASKKTSTKTDKQHIPKKEQVLWKVDKATKTSFSVENVWHWISEGFGQCQQVQPSIQPHKKATLVFWMLLFVILEIK